MFDIYLHCRISEGTLNVKFWNLKKFLFICKKFFIDDIGINCYYWKDSFTCKIEICYLTLVVSLWYSLSQALQGCLLLLVAVNSINSEDEGKLKKIRILNYIAMSFSFGILVADTIKMVFVHDEYYGLK